MGRKRLQLQSRLTWLIPCQVLEKDEGNLSIYGFAGADA